MQNSKTIIQRTQEFVRERLEGEGSGHDWWHIYRVWQMARRIAKSEKNADIIVVELAALLHDIADWKFNNGSLKAGPKIARKWLASMEVERQIIDHVYEIIEHTSFKGARVKYKMKTLEGMIVQDADRLDALGAIGIARTFAYGGYAKREIYNPDIKPRLHRTFKEYQNNQISTINHFYEKLLLLKGLLNTKTAKKIAEGRHKYMQDYLKKFYREWQGKI